MTIEVFNETGFHAGMKVTYKGKIRNLASVDFEESLIGLEAGEIECEECGRIEKDIQWVRCENCELIEED